MIILNAKTTKLVSNSLVVFLSTCLSVSAQNAPTAGKVYAEEQKQSLTYFCTKRANLIDCEFVQTSVRPKLSQTDYEAAVASQLKALEANPKQPLEACEYMNELNSALREERVPNLPDIDPTEYTEALSTKSIEELQDIRLPIETFSAFCENPSKDKYLETIEASLDIATRTCSVSTHTYEQTFTSLNGGNTWVVKQDGPQGPCGITNISRFEIDSSGDFGPFWNYHSQKIITNKDPNASDGFLNCSKLDEDEYLFSWKSITLHMNCDYIEFSIF
ncbi:hypothetical protein [Maritalea sp. S77]|uniref:hypothetical protein n=1 Tax=Maritalea sp. S77 TaxID=3415125 RepID=UPI003C7CDB70